MVRNSKKQKNQEQIGGNRKKQDETGRNTKKTVRNN